MLELKHRDCLGRICQFHINNKIIDTPNLMPVINPNQMIITPKEMSEIFGTQIIITNSYIINKSSKVKEKALEIGLHKLLDFNGAIMTDSGAFQTYVYKDINISFQDIVKFQKKIGSDIGTTLDILSLPDCGYENAKNDIETTLKRAKDSINLKGNMNLACTVQGSTYPDLRESCANKISELDIDFYPIGGVVPLMENYRFKELAEIIIGAKKGLSPEKPVHLFGCGHPMIFPIAVALGCDFFDSASYIKYAKDNRMLFPTGTKHLENITENSCLCKVCNDYEISEIKKMKDSERIRIIALHNLYVSFAEIKKIKQAIYEGNLWEMVEQRCRVHPMLLPVLNVLKNHKKYFERFENISKKSAFFYSGKESLNRPLVYRYKKRIKENYNLPNTEITITFDESEKPYSRHYNEIINKISQVSDAHFVINSVFGAVPIELDEIYPIAQSIVPKLEDLEIEVIEKMRKSMENYSHRLKSGMGLIWDGEQTFDFIRSMTMKKNKFDIDFQRVIAIMDFQFGKGANQILENAEIEIIKSKKTGKIRNIKRNGVHILSMRAHDGFFTLKIEGAKLLKNEFESPKLRVIVDDDSAEFNRTGKNVFSKFVIDCDDEIRPGDEVLIVDKDDILVAIGKALMNREEMIAFNNGVAVKVREGIK